MAQISQDLCYKVCPAMSPTFSVFGLSILICGIPLLYSDSLLLCYEDMRNSFTEDFAPIKLHIKSKFMPISGG